MKLTELNKLLNSELTTKIKKTSLENDELFIYVKVENLYSVLLFLKDMDAGSQYRQLIQSLQKHQGEMQKLIVDQQQEIDRLNKFVTELEGQVGEYEQSRDESG